MLDLIQYVVGMGTNLNKSGATNACAPSEDSLQRGALNNIFNYEVAVDHEEHHACSIFIIRGIPTEVNVFYNRVVIEAWGTKYLHGIPIDGLEVIN